MFAGARLALSTVKLVDKDRNFPTQAPPRLEIKARAPDPTATLRAFVDDFPGRILFVAESAGYRETTLELLSERGMRPARVDSWQDFLRSEHASAILVGDLERKFDTPIASVTSLPAAAALAASFSKAYWDAGSFSSSDCLRSVSASATRAADEVARRYSSA